MKRLAAYLPVGLLMLSIGCSTGGWCGSNQPAYPVGTYPLPGYPGGAYPNSPYSAGAPGQPGYAPQVGGQQPGPLPAYGTPIPPGYSQAGSYPASAYPGAPYPQNSGVPLNTIAPTRPFIGQ